ncbi:MAG: Asp-tRNA(Asn)/Glu-tRNA(Gln) amidotransferase subunit GatB [Litorivicinus sp.]
MIWETVIGLEIHTQLATDSKIFSGSSTEFGQAPNTQACAIDLGLPGILPSPNVKAFEYAAMFGMAIGAQVNRRSSFDRKNYFYPDLPKGYQTTQLFHPIVEHGTVEIQLGDETRTIGVTRAHLEEDAGKSLHEDFDGMSGIDLNRAGTPLIEIVSEPDMRSAREAVAYLKKIHAIVRYLGICDGNMAEGSFRCDANVSVRIKGEEAFGNRVEIKNINSFKFVEKAINHEVERQIELIEDGGTVVQETRLYDPDKDETRSMRSKEEANDYRYFPCPDLLPVELDDAFLEQVRQQLPELPEAKSARLIEEFGITPYDASVVTSDRALAEYFERAATHSGNGKLAANWVLGAVSQWLNDSDASIEQCPVSAERLGDLVRRIADDTINSKGAKKVWEAMLTDDGDVDSLIDSLGLKQVTDTSAIEAVVEQVIQDNAGQVDAYRAAEPDKQGKMVGFFVGQVMKASGGKANPQAVNQILRKKLGG